MSRGEPDSLHLQAAKPSDSGVVSQGKESLASSRRPRRPVSPRRSSCFSTQGRQVPTAWRRGIHTGWHSSFSLCSLLGLRTEHQLLDPPKLPLSPFTALLTLWIKSDDSFEIQVNHIPVRSVRTTTLFALSVAEYLIDPCPHVFSAV